MSSENDGAGLDELFELLDMGVQTEPPARGRQHTSSRAPARVTTMLPGPPMLRDDLWREILGDLRDHGVVAGGRAVEVIRAVSAMLSETEGGRRSGECLIAAIARRTGLQVKILNGTVFPDGPT